MFLVVSFVPNSPDIQYLGVVAINYCQKGKKADQFFISHANELKIKTFYFRCDASFQANILSHLKSHINHKNFKKFYLIKTKNINI